MLSKRRCCRTVKPRRTTVLVFALTFCGHLLGVFAFSPKSLLSITTGATKQSHDVLNEQDDFLEKDDARHIDFLGRRQWLTKTVWFGGVLSSLPKVSYATQVQELSKPEMYPASLCDPSVSTWRNPTNDRIVHLVGTAHVSESSALLAGQVVKDVRPDAVFVELDKKRISRALPTSTSNGEDIKTSSDGKSTDGNYRSDYLQKILTETKSSVSEDTSTNRPEHQRKIFFLLREKIVLAGSKVVGDAIKGMYSKLDSEGFKAGQEFVVAIREGLAIDAKIVLGDRDVEVTLRRLTEALTKTDIKKLFAGDSELEKSLDSLMPNGGGGGDRDAKFDRAVATERMTKEQFSQYVETVKARENVRIVMANLNETAPELYAAMVGERDAFMASGLASLDEFSTMVAVMGIAHVDGVEANLRDRGWGQVSFPCQVR